ncbi:unnamed protein product, partial [Polarella glacialis]
MAATMRRSPDSTARSSEGFSSGCSSPELEAVGPPPPRTIKPPRPPGAQRPQPHIQGLQSEQRLGLVAASGESSARSLSRSSEVDAVVGRPSSRGQVPSLLSADSQGYPAPPSSASSAGLRFAPASE